jgi:soluble lytic murein transglycosylase
VSRGARITASRTLATRLRYRDAIALIGNGYPWDGRRTETGHAAYPRAYERDIRPIARREKIDERLLYAVAREESAFDPSIVSTAGAVGLTQLLPSTADEEARRMRLASFDLRAPSDNLSIGFHYLGRLIRLQESIPYGLAAYNAGLTRIRAWKQQFAHLPPDLVIEAIPFEETRHYVRKVLVSASTYGVLYEGLPPIRTIELFYP